MKFNEFKFYNIDINFLAFLHSKDTEVRYSATNNYQEKPFLGMLVNIHDNKFLIPLTSAKKTRWS